MISWPSRKPSFNPTADGRSHAKANPMTERTPYDGKPYYCVVCGLGFAEWEACEEIDCLLESEARAKSRQAEHEDAK
jgi:hypothetical protein